MVNVRFAVELLKMCIDVVRFVYLLYQTLGMRFEEFVGALYRFVRELYQEVEEEEEEEEDVTDAASSSRQEYEASSSSSQEDEDVLRPGCAPGHVIESLPRALKFGNSGGCALCMELYSVADVAKTLPCQHQFHAGCIDRHLGYQSRLCPTCGLDVCPYQPNAEGR